MGPSVDAAGGQPQEALLSAILCDLQACISEPGRILYEWSRDIVRRLVFSRGTGAGAGGEIVIDAVKLAGAAEKETSAADVDDEDDFNPQIEDDDSYYAVDNFQDMGDGIDRTFPPPSQRVPYYDGESVNIRMAYCFSRYLVEFLAVRPRFRFVGTFVAFSDYAEYYCSSQRGQIGRTVDSQDNLILHSDGGAIKDAFSIRISIPEEDNMIDDDVGRYSFIVDPYTCNRAVTHTISTGRSRRIDVTFLPMHTAIQANVSVTLDLTSSIGSIYYVYGEITAHHQLYGDKSVMLFSHGKEDKAQVIDGKLPLSRNWAAVPIYLEPLLILKFNLRVPTNQDHDDQGRTISIQGDVTFYRDQYKKITCSEDHGKVIVQIAYR